MYYVWVLLYRFHGKYTCKKNIVRLYYFFLRMTIKRMTKYYISILNLNIVEKASLEFRLRNIDKIRNYLLDKICEMKEMM